MKRLLTHLMISLVLITLRGEEDVVPSGFPVSRYTAIWENSPFTREVIKAVEQSISSSFAQTLTLEGIVTDDTLGPIAYVRDMAENQPIVITKVKSESHPYTIVSANLVKNPEETKVTITDGTETGEIGYVIAKLNQPIQQFQPQPQQQQQQQQQQNRPPPNKDGKVPPGGGLQPTQRVPGNGTPVNPANPVQPEGANNPQSVTPALNNLDEEPRRRRVPLPGQ